MLANESQVALTKKKIKKLQDAIKELPDNFLGQRARDDYQNLIKELQAEIDAATNPAGD